MLTPFTYAMLLSVFIISLIHGLNGRPDKLDKENRFMLLFLSVASIVILIGMMTGGIK